MSWDLPIVWKGPLVTCWKCGMRTRESVCECGADKGSRDVIEEGPKECSSCHDPSCGQCVSCDAYRCEEHLRYSSYSDEYHCNPGCSK